jgi:hypothetical protein
MVGFKSLELILLNFKVTLFKGFSFDPDPLHKSTHPIKKFENTKKYKCQIFEIPGFKIAKFQMREISNFMMPIYIDLKRNRMV